MTITLSDRKLNREVLINQLRLILIDRMRTLYVKYKKPAQMFVNIYMERGIWSPFSIRREHNFISLHQRNLFAIDNIVI